MSTNPLRRGRRPSEDAISIIFIGGLIALVISVAISKSALVLLGGGAAFLGAMYLIARK